MRLSREQLDNILRLARLGYSDWEIYDATGHARSTVAYHRGKAGIPANHDRDGQRPRRRIPAHVINPSETVHPAVALYREELRRRSA